MLFELVEVFGNIVVMIGMVLDVGGNDLKLFLLGNMEE